MEERINISGGQLWSRSAVTLVRFVPLRMSASQGGCKQMRTDVEQPKTHCKMKWRKRGFRHGLRWVAGALG